MQQCRDVNAIANVHIVGLYKYYTPTTVATTTYANTDIRYGVFKYTSIHDPFVCVLIWSNVCFPCSADSAFHRGDIRWASVSREPQPF